jgi:hypothetical protein
MLKPNLKLCPRHADTQMLQRLCAILDSLTPAEIRAVNASANRAFSLDDPRTESRESILNYINKLVVEIDGAIDITPEPASQPGPQLTWNSDPAGSPHKASRRSSSPRCR